MREAPRRLWASDDARTAPLPEMPPKTTMSLDAGWVRALRTIVVAGLLVIALLGAVLGLIGATGPTWMWASDASGRSAVPVPQMPTGSSPG